MTRPPACLAVVLCTLAISLLHAQGTPSPEAPPAPICFTPEQVRCLLGRNCTDGLHDSLYPEHDGGGGSPEILLGRLRFPGTASSAQTRLFDAYEAPRPDVETKVRRRYADLPGVAGCAPSGSICFSAGGGADDDGDVALAFRPLRYASIFFNHSAYDATRAEFDEELASMGKEGADGVMITTIRDPGSYSAKWYLSRIHWDVVTDLKNASFEQWVERAPWRMNYFTRVLGARGGDRRTMPVEMLRTKRAVDSMTEEEKAAFVEDAYMKEQNRLGPERSEVYRLALERLENDFVYVGVFHRLRETWELLAHRFCWHVEELPEQPGLPHNMARGIDAMVRITKKDEVAAAKIWARLEELNRLDLAVVDAADKIMDRKVAEMRAEKANGIMCNFLGKVKVTCEKVSGTDEL